MMVSAGFTAAEEGKNDASTTNRLSTSWLRHHGSSTDVLGSSPKTSVPHWWVVFLPLCEWAMTTQKPISFSRRDQRRTSVVCEPRLLGR